MAPLAPNVCCAVTLGAKPLFAAGPSCVLGFEILRSCVGVSKLPERFEVPGFEASERLSTAACDAARGSEHQKRRGSLGLPRSARPL
jgi:hypothetical protein